MKRIFQATLVALMLVPAAGAAQDFDAGVRAARAGDFETALKEWKPLAEQGDAIAQLLLGSMYENGDGVPQDYAAAVRWWKLAAEQGHADAQNNLGGMYANGRGVPQDDTEAARWYRLAAEQGHAGSQNNLGSMYGLGRGVLQNNLVAHMWYNIASANGNESSGKLRDKMAAKMTAAGIEEAQRRARVCMASNYQDCD